MKGKSRCVLHVLVLSLGQLLLIPSVAAAERFYPTIPEVEQQLAALEANHPSLVRRHHLGRSVVDDLDIHALKVSSEVDVPKDKPVWLFIGVIHGNEHMGLRIVMDLAAKLTGEYETNPSVRKWVDAYDIWLVPYMNPVGYRDRVRGNRPRQWVDLNRNFDFHWKNGRDSVGASSYRGTAPFSEPESRAIRDLYLAIRPWFGMTFHHGNNPDGGQIMYPWNSAEGGFNPDRQALRGFAQRYADATFASRSRGAFCATGGDGEYILQDPDGEYCGATQTAEFCKKLCWPPSVSTMGIVGLLSNWAYSAVGTMDLVVEMTDRAFYAPFMSEVRDPGNEHERAVLDIAREFSRNYQEGIETLFDDFLIETSKGHDLRATGVTGHILDKETLQPIEAKVEFVGHTSPEISDRYSDARFGRFWRFLPEGRHTMVVSAPGYATHSETFRTSRNVMRKRQILMSRRP